MNWIVGTKYKTRGGETVTIVDVDTSIEVVFADESARAVLDLDGKHAVHPEWDLISLVGPTQYTAPRDWKSCG